MEIQPVSSGLVITITTIGLEILKFGKTERRKTNDLLVVTGDLGWDILVYKILERDILFISPIPNMQQEMEGYDYILERQLKPEAKPIKKRLKNST